jgi:succinate dehydrogenase/fumarate reductase flavoprotein subunit
MGGVAADVTMETEVPGLLVAGEAVGGANGANRLSGNAITEALVFGREAGRTALKRVRAMTTMPEASGREAVELINSAGPSNAPNTAAILQRLQAVMSDDVGPLRTRAKLDRALAAIKDMTSALGDRPYGENGRFNLVRQDWFDLRNMLMVARSVTQAAIAREESRGAHQREDFPGMEQHWNVNQTIRLDGGRIALSRSPASAQQVAAQ